MRYLVWPLRVLLFLLLLGFAVKNDQPVVLSYFFGYQWQASLIVILLVFFSAGVLIGVTSMLASMLRQRRELAAAQRELHLQHKLAELDAVQRTPS